MNPAPELKRASPRTLREIQGSAKDIPIPSTERETPADAAEELRDLITRDSTGTAIAKAFIRLQISVAPERHMRYSPTVSQSAALRKAVRRVDPTINLVDMFHTVVTQWPEFVNFVQQNHAKAGAPETPVLAYTTRYIIEAADFAHVNSPVEVPNDPDDGDTLQFPDQYE